MSLHTSYHDTTNYTSHKYLQVNSCGRENHAFQDYHVFRKVILYIISPTKNKTTFLTKIKTAVHFIYIIQEMTWLLF